MKFFIDSAITEEIKQALALGACDGVTTNPTLIMKSGRDFKEVVLEICNMVDGDVSAETVSLDAEGMMREARELAKWHKNIIVKIPMTDEGMKAVKQCAAEGIRTNVTLIFSAAQALLAAKAGAYIVSPFVGRLDDIGENGMGLIQEIVEIYDNYDFDTQILVASIRTPNHVIESAKLGAHIVTLPFKVLKQLYNHPLTDKGIASFLKDWENAKGQEAIAFK